MKIKWFTYFVMFYLLLASSWWTLLLYNKNQTEFNYKKELSNYISDYSEADIANEYRRQRKMILGEGIFLGCTLIAGIWLIYRGNRKELDTINRQNNFLLAITHELKSPLSSIDLILQTIENRQLDKDQLSKLIQTGGEEVKRLERMIKNLLLSSKEEHTSELSFRTVEIDQVLFNILLEFRERFPDSDISFLNHSNKSIKSKADENLLSIAIRNIVDNAQKYGDNSKITIELSDFDGNIQIKISDYGVGINQRDKKKIFDRFFRSGDEWTRTTTGTGIGLFISKKIIGAHSGNIQVEDNLPNGTTFLINLPSDVH